MNIQSKYFVMASLLLRDWDDEIQVFSVDESTVQQECIDLQLVSLKFGRKFAYYFGYFFTLHNAYRT